MNLKGTRYECLFPDTCKHPYECEAQLMREYDYIRKSGIEKVVDWGVFAPARISSE